MTIMLTFRVRIAKLFRFNFFHEDMACNFGTLLLPYFDWYGHDLAVKSQIHDYHPRIWNLKPITTRSCSDYNQQTEY